MRYNKIRKMDISNGPGIRISIFVQGCTFHCKDCFNPETHDFSGGSDFDEDMVNTILDLASPDYIAGLSILGGEPLHPRNVSGVLSLVKSFKRKYPQKTIWIWSGFLWEDYIKNLDILPYVDVIVDGQFISELHDPRLKYCGSSNQRVIDIKKTLNEKKIILFDKEESDNDENERI